MELSEIYRVFTSSSGVSTDTRSLAKNQLFVALKGPNHDANQWAAKALDKGASYAIVDNPDVVTDDRYILVEDGLICLQELAKLHRSHFDIPVLGITGSNGKTTTKELLVQVLSETFRVSATKGNYNNHIGVPLTLLNADIDADILIVEMGTNQPGDIEFLCDIASPDLGLITNIGLAHLEMLKSREGILDEKSSLYRSVEENQGTIFVNTSDPMLARWATYPKVVTYGLTGTEDIGLDEIATDGPCLHVSAEDETQRIIIETNLSGAYNLNNIAAAMAIGRWFDMSLADIAHGIESYVPSNQRSQIIETGRNTIIADAYNANPTSMIAALQSFFGSQSAQDKIVIIGDMLELGDESEHHHREIMDMIHRPDVLTYMVGERFWEVAKEGMWCYHDVDELLESGELAKINDAHILVKGSRGVKLEKVYPEL